MTRKWISMFLFVALAGAFAVSTTIALRYVGQAMDRGAYFEPGIRGAEWHRIGLRSMSEAFPTRTVSRGGPVAIFPELPRVLDDVIYSHAGERHTIAEFLDRNHTHGIVVLHRGALVYERYFAGADEGSRFTSHSVAKSITATLVGFALAEGKIRSLDDTVENYIEALRGTSYDGVSIDQVLEMRSGVAFREEYDEGGSDIATFMRASAIEQAASADTLAASFPRGAEPGTVYNYNTAETQILGWLIREVTKKSHAAYLEEKLWRPLGMEHDASIVLDRPGAKGVELAGSCLNASLRDWARFGQLHLQDGVWRGKQLLPEGWVATVTHVVDDANSFYRYQWWLLGEGRYAAEGIHGQFIYIDPANDLVIAKASFWPTAWEDALEEETMDAFEAIGRHLSAE